MTLFEVLNALTFVERSVTSTHFETNIERIDVNIEGDWHNWCINFHTKEIVDADGKPVDTTTLENVCKMVRKATKEKMINKSLKVYADLLSATGYDLGSINTELARMKKSLEE